MIFSKFLMAPVLYPDATLVLTLINPRRILIGADSPDPIQNIYIWYKYEKVFSGMKVEYSIR